MAGAYICIYIYIYVSFGPGGQVPGVTSDTFVIRFVNDEYTYVWQVSKARVEGSCQRLMEQRFAL